MVLEVLLFTSAACVYHLCIWVCIIDGVLFWNDSVYVWWGCFQEWLLCPVLLGPRVDGKFLPNDPTFLMKEARHKRVDLILGTNKHEGAIVTFRELYNFSSLFLVCLSLVRIFILQTVQRLSLGFANSFMTRSREAQSFPCIVLPFASGRLLLK